jgi:hypothetical protein
MPNQPHLRAIAALAALTASTPALAQPSNPQQIVPPATAAAMAYFPNPELRFTGREIYQANGRTFARYRYDVVNKNEMPAELFAPAPDLPPCGRNANSARTWVDVYTRAGIRLYGFCALGNTNQLGQIWFALPADAAPPAQIFIVMTDRRLGRTYQSNLAPTR